MTEKLVGWWVAWWVVVFRRFLCWAVLALVVVAGGALGQVQRAEAAEASPVQVSDDESPCVVRAECAGAGLLVGMGLLLIVATSVPMVGAVVAVGRVRTAPQTLRSRLAGQRLDRPPQFFS